MSGDQGNSRTSPPLCVVVVEDDKSTRGLLVELLEDEGFVVQAAANGAAGLTLLREHPPDVALVDLQMPVVDGLMLYDAMRAEPSLADVPVVFMSAAPDWRGLDQRGIESCLHKPFEIDELVQLVLATGQRRHRQVLAAEQPSKKGAIPLPPLAFSA